MLMPHKPGRQLKLDRRSVLAISAATLTGLAGCTGNDADSNEETVPTDFPDWNPSNPEFPQPLEALLFETPEILDQSWGYNQGSTEDLNALPDRDEPAHGDPPLDVPDDESELIAPDPLVMTVMPDIEGATFPDTFDALIKNIETETGRTVEYQVLDSTAGMVEGMRSGRIHLGHFNGGAVPDAVNIAGGRPIAMGLFGEGEGPDPWGIRTYTITQMNNDDIDTVDDLKGKTVAHTSETSNSGHMAPLVFLKDEGIVPGDDYEIEFSGGHQQSIRSIPLGDYDAANVASTWIPWFQENEDEFDLDDYKVVFASELMPNLGSPAITRYDLDPDIVDGIKRAYFDYDYTDTLIEEEMSINYFVEFPDYSTVMDFILNVHKENGREYDLDALN